MRWALCILILIIVSIAGTVFMLWPPFAPTFSSTQTWNEHFLSAATADTIFSEEELSAITLPPLPDKKTVQKELELLHVYSTQRDEQKLAEINREVTLDNAFFGSTTLTAIAENKPHTSAFIKYTIEKSGFVIFRFKKAFDRVRPSFLDPTLTTAIDVPLHPAYPSGHATQATLVAFVLSELDPTNSEAYFASADRIAQNREVAGVHYPSDSAAGKLLGQKLFLLFLQNEEFAQMLERAHTEW